MTDTIKGSLWMVGGVFCLTSMAVAGKEISLQIDTFEILFYRSVIGVSIILFFLIKKDLLHEVNLKEIRTHLKRNIAHFTGQNLWLYALASITLAEVTSLEFTMPIWIVLFSYLMLNEQLDKYKILSVLIGFLGVLITVRPDIESINLGLVAAAISAIVFALTNIYTRRLTRTESTLAILFFLTTMQLIFGLITSLLDGELDIPTNPMSTDNILYLSSCTSDSSCPNRFIKVTNCCLNRCYVLFGTRGYFYLFWCSFNHFCKFYKFKKCK